MVATSESLGIGLERRNIAGNGALQGAVKLWFVVALIGQLLFAVHIISFYGRTALTGNFAAWNRVMSLGYVAGDAMGNSTLGLHLSMAGVITLMGVLQLIPQIRQRIPVFHRWLGRVYIPAAFLAAASALYLVLIRGKTPGGALVHTASVLNAVVIMLCAALALRYALARNLTVHRRWALRLFLASSGVWFFRVGLFFWLIVNQGPAGFNPDTFEGPFLDCLSFAQFLLPLAVLELYFFAQRRAGAAVRYVIASTLVVLTVVTAIGIFGHFMFVVHTGTAA